MKNATNLGCKKRFLLPLSACALLGLGACDNRIGQDSLSPIGSFTAASSPGSTFGTLCQSAFQNNWRDTLPYAYNRCEGFNNELSATDTQKFYFNLKGGKPFLETDRDQDLVETVDMLYLSTHGGLQSDSSRWAMWDMNTRAFTKNMTLGNEGKGLSILSTYSCDTLGGTDSEIITHWKTPFSGGLRYVAGAWDVLWDGITTDECGEDYADNLQDGMTIQDAWTDAIWDWATTQHPAVQTTGTSEADCLKRKKDMKFTNFSAFSRVSGSAVKWYCGHRWTF